MSTKSKSKVKPKPPVLSLDPQNARLHPQRNLDLIAQSLNEIGPFRSIAVDADGIVRAGNGVFQKAVEKGFRVTVVQADPDELIAVQRLDLSGRQAERAALLDNRSGETSEWDTDRLAAYAEQDRAILAGLWDEKEISELARLRHLNEHPLELPPVAFDQAELLREKWGTAEGQVWEIDSASAPTKKHYLFIGSCRETKIMRPVADTGPHIGCFTSPPYAEQRARKYGGIPTDGYVEWWWDVQEQLRRCLDENGLFFVNLKAHCEIGERTVYPMQMVIAMREWGWKFIDEFAWVKPGYPGDMGKRFKNGFEPIYQFALGLDYKFRLEHVQEYRQSRFGGYSENLERIQGERGTPNQVALETVRPSNVLHLMPDSSSLEEVGGHPARFPPTLPEFFIQAYSDLGDRWLDNFAGSGTTGIMAERLGRVATQIELHPRYGAVILERYLLSFNTVGRLVAKPKIDRRKKAPQPPS